MKKELPVYWGNHTWMQDESGRIIKGEEISSDHEHWTDYSQYSTYTSELYDDNHPHAELRKQWQKQIIADEIEKHKSAACENPLFFMFSGGTASGKTSAVETLLKYIKNSEHGNGLELIEINYDKIKKEILEYKAMIKTKNKRAAELVQKESAKIAGTILKKSIKLRYNIIFEFNFCTNTVILQRLKEVRKRQYLKLILHYTFVDVETALKRAKERAKETGRYVPEDYIRKAYKAIPKNIKAYNKEFNVFWLHDNRHPHLRNKDRLILMRYDGKWKITNKEAYKEYLETVGPENSLHN